jgi:dihydroorotase
MVITNVVVCDAQGERNEDVRIIDGKITEVGSNLNGEPRIDGNGAYLLPGIVDTNVRLKDSQLNGKNIERLAAESLAGGATTVVIAPDSTPSVDNEIVLEFVQRHRNHEKGAKIETTVASTNEDEMLSNIAIMLKRGALAPYMTTSVSNNVACRIAEYVKMYGVTLFCKAQDTSLSSVGVMTEGKIATKLGLVGIPPLGETVHVARMIEIARNFGISILFKSIASPRSIEMITKAKHEGVDVMCEVSIHHLLHCDEACDGFNTAAKLNPPLPSKVNMQKLVQFFKEGEIDLLTALHQPNSPVNKEVAFADAAYGCAAIAEALPLYYTKLVQDGMIKMGDLVRLVSANPAAIIGKRSGAIAAGMDADLILFDPKAETVVEAQDSLYRGETLNGKVTMAFIDGEIVRL